MTLPDNDPAKWQYQEHTAVKHQILDGYLHTWISILGGSNLELGYIDGFAGRGVYQDGSIGSPIIAMDTGQNQISKINRKPYGMKKFRCFFVEKNVDNYFCLKEQVESRKSTCPDVIPDIRNGVFEEHATEFIEVSKKIPTLFFIDPFGWEVPFEIIKGILDNLRTEILFTFMVYDINRFLGSTAHQASLNKLYGSSVWKDCLDSEDRESCLVNHYLDSIRKARARNYSVKSSCPQLTRQTA
ncbi:MAG: three-Cys-motif partner protein TcmP [Candidatus Bathyarchaeia archaeon]|jgi:three-Cys-motif partner protein